MRQILIVNLTLFFLFSSVSCKQSSTAPETAIPEEPDISISCSPSSGGAGTSFTVSIALNDTKQEIKVFGMDMTFDANHFQFQGAGKGSLTATWADVDANEVDTGRLKIGGFTGSVTPIPSGSRGAIAEVSFKVRNTSITAGQNSRICIDNYTDDISQLTPRPACVNFELK